MVTAFAVVVGVVVVDLVVVDVVVVVDLVVVVVDFVVVVVDVDVVVADLHAVNIISKITTTTNNPTPYFFRTVFMSKIPP